MNKRVVFAIYLFAALAATLHLILLGSKSFNGIDGYTHFNNFVIFRNAFFHLVQHQDLYVFYPQEQYDLFKYSPTFALLMFPFAALPAWAGAVIWNLGSASLLFYAISKLPFATPKLNVFALWFVLQEALTGMQSVQTNPVIAAFLMMAFVFMERQDPGKAALLIVLALGIKIFGVLGFLLFFIYPNKSRFFLYALLWSAIFILLPLIVITPQELIWQYENWWRMLQSDHAASYGLSVMGWLKSWFGLEPEKGMVVVAGAVLLMIPLIRMRAHASMIYRSMFMASLMIWMIIFNHKAESSTFVIAVCGIVLWYFSQKPNHGMTILMMVAFVLTCMSPTDLFPRSLRKEMVEPYVLKAVPCIAIWVWIEVQLILGNYTNRPV